MRQSDIACVDGAVRSHQRRAHRGSPRAGGRAALTLGRRAHLPYGCRDPHGHRRSRSGLRRGLVGPFDRDCLRPHKYRRLGGRRRTAQSLSGSGGNTEIKDLPLHATPVMFDGQAMLISGPSGAEKSTFTTALLDVGAELIGAEPPVVRAAEGRLATWSDVTTIRLPDTESRPQTDAETPLATRPCQDGTPPRGVRARPQTPPTGTGTQTAERRFVKAVCRGITTTSATSQCPHSAPPSR